MLYYSIFSITLGDFSTQGATAVPEVEPPFN